MLLFQGIEDFNNYIQGELGLTFHIPEFQRPLDNEHVNKIVNDVQAYINKHGFQPSLGTIQVCCYDNSCALVDGQHRYNGIERLEELGGTIEFTANIIQVDDYV